MQAQLQNVTLEYAVTGPADAPAILLIRGLGTQMIEWPQSFVEALVDHGLRVVTFDNRDVGLSSKCTEQYTLSDMAADVVGLMDHLHLPQATIFGISLGGMVAQLVAVEHSDRVRALVSVMSGSGNPDVPTVSPEMLPHLLEKAEGRDAVIALAAEHRALFGSPAYPESEAARIAAATRAYERCYCPQGVARQMRAANSDGSRVARLQQIRVPTLVLHGAEDRLVNPAAGRDTAQHIPHAQFELIPGMGHNIPAQIGGELAGRVSRFLDETLGDSASSV